MADSPEARIPAVAERLVRLWPEATGESGSMPRGALRLALTQAWLESGVAEAGAGGWWKGAMVGSGNLGAIQCSKSDAGGETYSCVAYTDKHADGTPYSINFRYYKAGAGRDAGDNAALDFLKHIATRKTFLRDPNAAQSFETLKTGDTHAYAASLYNQHYYEGSGDTDDARIASYVKALDLHTAAVDAALDSAYGSGGLPAANDMTADEPSGAGVPVLPAVLITASAFAIFYAALNSDKPFERIERAIAERSFWR